ncbi:MAG: DUF45 domain-containing protein [Candidatus Aenigmarchaeota archaeon]|nr:DUF45 domain-containing protein [Candidatus Aenigmarchaeota archaeon]
MDDPRHIIEVKEYVCPFCNSTKQIKTKDVVIGSEHHGGFHADEWTCHTCGSENGIFDEIEFSRLKNMTIQELSNLNDFDIVELFQFAGNLVQKKEFKRALPVLKHILSQDPYYDKCRHLIEKVEKVMELKNLARMDMDIGEIINAINDHSEITEYFLDMDTGKIICVSGIEPDNEKEEIPEGSIPLLKIPSHKGYKKMEEFIGFVYNKDMKEKLIIAIQGSGAFSRFRFVLDNYTGDTEYKQMWQDFYNQFVWQEAMDFIIFALKTRTEIKPKEFVEINGIKYPVCVEEKDTNICSARFVNEKLMITISARLCEHEKKRITEKIKMRLKTKLEKPRQKKFIEPIREFKNCDIIDLGKRKYAVKIDFADKKSSSGRLVGNTIHLIISNNLHEDIKKQHTYDLVRKILSRERKHYLYHKLKDLNKTYFNAKFKDVRWARQMSRWGSCSENKYINISYRLLFAPEDVLEYVCIHELAHLIEFNHSQRFWKLVSKAMPDYKEKEKWLEENCGVIF